MDKITDLIAHLSAARRQRAIAEAAAPGGTVAELTRQAEAMAWRRLQNNQSETLPDALATLEVAIGLNALSLEEAQDPDRADRRCILLAAASDLRRIAGGDAEAVPVCI